MSVIKMDDIDRDAAIKEEQDLKTTVDRECATEDNELNTNGMISDYSLVKCYVSVLGLGHTATYETKLWLTLRNSAEIIVLGPHLSTRI